MRKLFIRIHRSFADRRPYFFAGVAGGIVAMGISIGLKALHLTRDQQVDFMGSAFGVVATAITAFGVIEYQTFRAAGRAIKIVDHFLRDAQVRLMYVQTLPEGEVANSLETRAIIQSLNSAADLAKEHQLTSIGMAQASNFLPIQRDFAGQILNGDHTALLASAATLIDGLKQVRSMIRNS